MSALLYSLGRWSYRHPWRVLIAWLLVLGIAGGGALAFNKGTDNTFSIPGTESQAGLEQLSRTFPQVSGTSAQILVVAAEGDTITDAAYRAPIDSVVDELGALDGVLSATSPFDEMVDGMLNDAETAAIIRLQFDGQGFDVPEESTDALHSISEALRDQLPAGAQTALGGDLFATSIPGVSLIEAVGLIIALIVLIVTFRSFVVAGLPLITAIIGVGISMAAIFIATAFATVSSTTPLLALMLGLAVGIDYALFIVSRHQDQVRSGTDPEESAAQATGTAGSAVVFAGVTVLIALIGLGFAGIPFLTTMGIAASVAVAIAVAIAVTLTPAFLGFLGHRVAGKKRHAKNAKNTKNTGAQAQTQPETEPRMSASARWVRGVTKHPVLAAAAVIAGLGALAIPAASLQLALPNAGMLPADSEARISYDLTAEQFGPGFNGPLILTGTIVTSTDPLGLMADLQREVEAIPGVDRVALATPNENADTGIVQIIPTTAPDAPETADLVRELRSHHDAWLNDYGIDLSVTGYTAVAIDISDQLGAALFPFGAFVIGLSLILLAIVFRSIWVPVTAALGYLLSIVAAFGVVAAVFEWGWFADALQVTRVGPVISFMPIVLMGVLFGLAMDYQVFLVSRMREDFVHDNERLQGPDAAHRAARRAVRTGFASTARVVTAAALIMFAVFVAFVPEGDSSLKPIALGLATGIAIDAFLVRMTLIPALMTILGRHAWWLPAWLSRLLPHVDIEGEAVEHERSLSGWPGDGSAVAADNLVVATTARDIVVPHLRVAPGRALVITGSEHERSLLALTVAGRSRPTSGDLRVDSHIVPTRASTVRRTVGFAALASSDAAAQLREALRGNPRVVVVTDIDIPASAARDQHCARLRDARTGSSERGPLTIIATAQNADQARAALAQAGWHDSELLDLTALHRRRTSSFSSPDDASSHHPAKVTV
ncbi:MMPL family transporter [Microbacterium sp. YY-01]|uniref:MMPL family transporter n=1 Tax=Microbacterium sp. YY-01 TaxID=3421634 RepID=UPI003D17E643